MKYFTQHRAANKIQLFFSYSSKSQQQGIPLRLIDKCSHLFIFIALKQTLKLMYHDISCVGQPYTLPRAKSIKENVEKKINIDVIN